MTTYVLDAEWYSSGDVVLDAEYLHCVCFKELRTNNKFDFVNHQDGIRDYAEGKPWPHDIEELPKIFKEGRTYIGHNILNADFEVFRRVLGIPFTVGPDSIVGKECTFIDTLTMSRRLNPDRQLPKGCPTKVWNPVTEKNDLIGPHSLMAWSYKLRGEKPVVHDWRDQPIQVYLERCRADVELTEELYLYLTEKEMK